ncbi:MAG: gamma carbonic anhydrase family protein [Bdellovibrionales bacterium]|nr:gamma carbonic anhydrase family protein [Bdellovibrionales bacterium]
MERVIIPHHGKWPRIHETAFVAPSADLIGEVEIGPQSSLWFQVVARGDVNWIKIGARTNIQDMTMLHVTRRTCPLTIGDDVTVGHHVMLHGCTVGSRVLVGMRATVMDKAVIPDDSVIGAGALVTEGKTFPPKHLILGSPAKAVRPLTDEELAFLKKSAENYVKDAEEYRSFLRGPKRHGGDDQDLEVPYLDEEDLE